MTDEQFKLVKEIIEENDYDTQQTIMAVLESLGVADEYKTKKAADVSKYSVKVDVTVNFPHYFVVDAVDGSEACKSALAQAKELFGDARFTPVCAEKYYG